MTKSQEVTDTPAASTAVASTVASTVASADASAPARSFEDTLGQLEEHVRRLDSGDLPLEDALRLFEQGVGLVRECQDLLDGAERRIVELSPGPDGINEATFDGGARGQD